MRIVPPEQVIGDQTTGRVKDPHRPDYRERFIRLQV
jgi:hypothetical protein